VSDITGRRLLSLPLGGDTAWRSCLASRFQQAVLPLISPTSVSVIEGAAVEIVRVKSPMYTHGEPSVDVRFRVKQWRISGVISRDVYDPDSPDGRRAAGRESLKAESLGHCMSDRERP